MFRDDSARLRLLLETRRIVLTSLPFRAGEYRDSMLINDLMVKEQFRTVINAKTVMHFIIEMYAAVKREIKQHLRKGLQDGAKSLTMVTDFWTCKPQHVKYLGVRVYFMDDKWTFNLVMLGTRCFNPAYGERDTGIHHPFKRWITDMLSDFGLSQDNFFGAMSDGDSDVKWMMNEGHGLLWEWCIPHMTHTATKWVCGLVDNKADSHNVEMTELVERIKKTVRTVRDVEKMGGLFQFFANSKEQLRSQEIRKPVSIHDASRTESSMLPLSGSPVEYPRTSMTNLAARTMPQQQQRGRVGMDYSTRVIIKMQCHSTAAQLNADVSSRGDHPKNKFSIHCFSDVSSSARIRRSATQLRSSLSSNMESITHADVSSSELNKAGSRSHFGVRAGRS
ncbi:hypothetical protein FI667_g1682, partial [Globisporangium splendens]